MASNKTVSPKTYSVKFVNNSSKRWDGNVLPYVALASYSLFQTTSTWDNRQWHPTRQWAPRHTLSNLWTSVANAGMARLLKLRLIGSTAYNYAKEAVRCRAVRTETSLDSFRIPFSAWSILVDLGYQLVIAGIKGWFIIIMTLASKRWRYVGIVYKIIERVLTLDATSGTSSIIIIINQGIVVSHEYSWVLLFSFLQV